MMQVSDVRLSAAAPSRAQRRASRASAACSQAQATSRRAEAAFSGLSSTSAHGVALVASSSRAQRRSTARFATKVEAKATGPMKVIIAGAPASGKGTQCEMIVEKYGLAHISAGDLLRAEVAAGTEAGKTAKKFMDNGDLVPDEVVVTMVKTRLAQSDAQTKGWLLDGYPRSESQGLALEQAGIHPELFMVLNVPDDVIVERVVGRRLDPDTGKIYHLKFAPPPPEVAGRLTQRSDDTEDKCRNRLAVHAKNVNSVSALYKTCIKEINGDRDKKVVFQEIDGLLSKLR